MLSVKRVLHKSQSSHPTMVSSSGEITPTASRVMTPSPRAPMSLSQRFSNTAGPFLSFPGANGEFSRLDPVATHVNSHSCAAQMDVITESHGIANPNSFDFDQSSGYLPINGRIPGVSGSLETTEKGRSTLESFLHAVSSERLNRMPHRASKWDRMIRILESLAIQVAAFTNGYDSLPSTTCVTAPQLYATFHSILRISSSKPSILDFAIPIFSVVRSILTPVLRQKDLLDGNERIKHALDTLIMSVHDAMKQLIVHSKDFTSDTRAGGTLFHKSINIINSRKDQLLDEIWTCHVSSNLLGSQGQVIQMTQIRQWLRPDDGMIWGTYTSLQAARARYAEFTCEWFSKPLLDFIRSSSSVFWVEGPVGCGKSMLYGWIVDNLQNQVCGQEYAVLSHHLDPLLPSEMEVSCLLKGLLQQALEQDLASISLHTALTKAMTIASISDGNIEVSEALWLALDAFLLGLSHPTIILIDGLSGLNGGAAAARECLQRLSRGVSQSQMARLVILSRPLDQLPDVELRHFVIQPSSVHEDVRRVVNSTTVVDHLENRPELNKWIIGKANGNFLWALLVLQNWTLLNDQASPTPLKSLPVSLNAIVPMLVSKVDFDDPTTSLLLITSLVAVRPLNVAEAQILLNINMARKSFNRQELDMFRIVDQGCGSIMTIEDGTLYFRHALFKRSILEVAENRMKQTVGNMHINMTNRLLLYLGFVLTTRSELTLNPIPSTTLEELLTSNQLLTYALRHWTYHLIQSGSLNSTQSITPKGSHQVSLPESTFVSAVEATYWTGKPYAKALPALRVAAQSRQVFLGKHQATLQTVASLAMFCKNSNQLPEAVSKFATAFQLAQQLLPDFHDFAVVCVSSCLEILESVSDSASLDLSVPLSEMLLYLISMYDKQYGPGDDRALDCYYRLACYYADTDQYGLSTKTHRDIYRLTIDRYGKSSPQAKAVASEFTSHLQKSDQSDDNLQFNNLIYENVASSLPITDDRRIKTSILKAETCKSQNDTSGAELEYLTLLHGITESFQLYQREDDQQKLVKISLLYAGFLLEQKRKEEAQSTLLGLWNCFVDQQDRTFAVNDLLKNVATEVKQAELPATALEILQSIAEWSRTHDGGSIDLCEVEKAISAIESNMVGDIQSTSILPKSTEDALMQNFESAKSHGPSKVSTSLFAVCRTLIDSFTLEKRWDDVLYVASSTLGLSWPAVLSEPGESRLSREYNPEMGYMAVSLAKAYSMVGAERLAGNIYWHVLQSAKSAGFGNSPFFASVVEAAMKTFQNTAQPPKLIDTMQELVYYYQAELGEDDPTTIESSYALALICVEHGEIEIAIRNYTKITSVFQRSGYHDQRGLPALQALLAIFRTKKLWDQSEKVYSCLWQTFLTNGKKSDMSPESARVLHQEYSQFLEHQRGAEATLLQQIHKEYWRGCATSYGEQALVTLEAAIGLAKSYERSRGSSLEAIPLYESIIDGQGGDRPSIGSDIAEMIEQVEALLREYYRAHLNNDMAEETLSRASCLQKKQYYKDKAYFGPCSQKSLSSLATYVSILTQRSSPQFRQEAVQKLQEAVDAVPLSNCEGKALYDTASILASSFIENGYSTEGSSTAEKIRAQIIFREQASDDTHLWDASKLTFLTAFETRLKGSMEKFAEIHSRSLLEMALWDSFQTLSRGTSSMETILTRGSSLQALLKDHYPSYKGDLLQRQLIDRFVEHYAPAFTSGSRTVPKFCTALINRLGTEHSDTELPDLACITIKDEAQRLVDQGEFKEALDVCIPGFDFVRHVGAFGKGSGLQCGFQLGLILGDVCPQLLSSDQDIKKQIFEFSKQVLREVLHLCRAHNLDLDSLSIKELSKVAAVLGRQQNYHDLEWLLNRLWASRHKRDSMSQDVIITLGRRLVDVRFFHGHIDSAIDLAEDILYNLRQVYGPSHPWAVQMMNLLSSIYMSKGDRAAAMAVHEAAGSSVDNPDAVTSPISSQDEKLVKSKLEQLLHCYQQSDDPNGSPRRQSAQLIDELSKRLHAPPNAKSGHAAAHQPPANWSFAIDGHGEQSARMEELA